MHPAFSVIFLTTLIGAGQGLFLALFTAQTYAAFDLLPAQTGPGFYAPGSVLALAFLVMVGMALTAEAFDAHVPKGYLYAAMAFSLAVEALNIRARAKRLAAQTKPTL